MAYLSTLDSLSVEVVALDTGWEAMAREYSALPVSLDATTLRIVLPSATDLSDFIEKITFLNPDLELQIDTAEREKTDDAINFHYPAKYANVENCGVQFRVQCPKRWYTLQETDQPDIRFCNVCERNVFLCWNEVQAKEHAKKGNCVALAEEYSETDNLMGMLMLPEDEFK